MFTGIVQHIGAVKQVQDLGDNSLRIEIDCKDLNASSQIGDSVSIDGVCLTVEKVNDNSLSFTAIAETLSKTKMVSIKDGDLVNVEKSATFQDLVGGHPSSGHIDTTGIILKISQSDSWSVLRIGFGNDFKNLIVSKGSISLNGVSLTISDLQVEDKQPWFEVSLVPVTLSKTTLNSLQVGSKVNIEFDQVGKYIAQNLRMQNER
jgi:riboflavin synthase